MWCFNLGCMWCVAGRVSVGVCGGVLQGEDLLVFVMYGVSGGVVG